MKKQSNILIQCDFDGTITIEDASFTILDAYIPEKWHPLFNEYQQGQMTVGEFNSTVFAMINADKEILLKTVREKVSVRAGFKKFLEYCRLKDYRFVIVSNGLDFYIKDILGNIGFMDVEVHASETIFGDNGLIVRHRGPSGQYLDKDVKAAFTDHFITQGYHVIYLGDGRSDVLPASKSHHIFATGSLIEYCNTENLTCTAFIDFNQVVNVMDSWQ